MRIRGPIARRPLTFVFRHALWRFSEIARNPITILFAGAGRGLFLVQPQRNKPPSLLRSKEDWHRTRVGMRCLSEAERVARFGFHRHRVGPHKLGVVAELRAHGDRKGQHGVRQPGLTSTSETLSATKLAQLDDEYALHKRFPA